MNEREEFEDYARARQDWLYRTAVLLCGDRYRAQDLTQTTLVKLFQHWAKAGRADSVDAYARTVLTRTFLSEQRRNLLGRRLQAVESNPSTTGDPALRVTLLAALRELPPRQRAMVVLRYWEDLSVDTVASLLGCRPGTVKSQCTRGLTRLREGLQDAEHITAEY